jgi:hypothetical membrane protein
MVVYVGVFTLAGFLRPGYSPIHQAISDLGVGPNGWLLDVSAVITGLLLMGFAVGFTLSMQPVLSRGWRRLSAVLLALRGLGLAIAGIFTEAPSTLPIHWLVGANLAFFGPKVSFLVTGLALRRAPRWHRWRIGFLVASLLTLVLLLASLRLGGLMERVSVIEIKARYVALGWGLFVWVGSHLRSGAQQAYQGEPEQSRGEQDAPVR